MTIVAAVDASPAAARVVEKALDFARDDGDIHVVHVFQPPSTVYPVEGMYLADDEEFERAEHDMVWKELEGVMESAPATLQRVELKGYPASAIVEHAREVDASLIVVGTRGRGGFASLVLGSTSQAVIHDAPCDVLVVKTAAE
ncbi:MAG: universal stress protein [Actinomycetota bacterium]